MFCELQHVDRLLKGLSNVWVCLIVISKCLKCHLEIIMGNERQNRAIRILKPKIKIKEIPNAYSHVAHPSPHHNHFQSFIFSFAIKIVERFHSDFAYFQSSFLVNVYDSLLRDQTSTYRKN